jgi:hypothetical protein
MASDQSGAVHRSAKNQKGQNDVLEDGGERIRHGNPVDGQDVRGIFADNGPRKYI